MIIRPIYQPTLILTVTPLKKSQLFFQKVDKSSFFVYTLIFNTQGVYNMFESRGEQLTAVLKGLETSSPEIEASAVISTDGLVMASAFPVDIEEDRVAAMSAAMLSLGERTAGELGRGTLEQIYIKGEGGYVFLMSAGADAVLTALARQDAKLGMIFLEMKRTAEKIAEIV